jgi:hypothetical protein
MAFTGTDGRRYSCVTQIPTATVEGTFLGVASDYAPVRVKSVTFYYRDGEPTTDTVFNEAAEKVFSK